MPIKDELGDRIKAFEAVETARILDRAAFTVFRVDGRAFSSFTRGMDRPYDARLAEAMIAAAKALIVEFDAPFAFTQSDEITLILPPRSGLSELPFGGKAFKLTSIAAGVATAAFAPHAIRNWPEKGVPSFDARVFSVPTADDAGDALVWRMRDAYRNAVSMAAQSLFSHKKLQNVSVRGMLQMMRDEKAVDFDAAYPARFRRGVLLRRVVRERLLDAVELARIPERYRPTGPVPRTLIDEEPITSEGAVRDLLFPERVAA